MIRTLFGRKKTNQSQPHESQHTSKDSSEYVYQRLPGPVWTRLCTLLPGRKHERIRCLLTTHCLDDIDVTYEALSYTWDNPEKVNDIECDGNRLAITRALYSALLRLRGSAPRKLWIDAICIDQSSTPAALSERAQQVRMMHLIFSKAQRVVVDLGDGSEQSDRALRLMEAIRKASVAQSRRPSAVVSMKKLGLPEWDDARWLDALTFMTRRWFSRVWVVQEYALAREIKIMLGAKVLDIDTLIVAYNMLLQNLQRLQMCLLDEPQHMQLQRRALKGIGMFGMMNLLRTENQSGKTLKLAEMLDPCRMFDATDQRDKVYGLLGLASDRDEIVVDYEINEIEVFTHTAVCLVRGGRIDAVLPSAGALDTINGLPSWVPDYSLQKLRGIMPLLHDDIQPPFKAGLEVPANAIANADVGCLELDGFLVDKITHLTEAWTIANEIDWQMFENNGGSAEYVRRLAKWMESARELVSTNSPVEEAIFYRELPDFFWITLIGGKFDQARDFAPGISFESAVSGVIELCEVLQQINREPSAGLDTSDTYLFMDMLNRPESKYLSALSVALSDKKLCYTEAGRLGLVSSMAKVGDAVAVFGGTQTPFVLRSRQIHDQVPFVISYKDERGSFQYHFLGSCYVHGTMRGEAIHKKEEPLQRLVLV